MKKLPEFEDLVKMAKEDPEGLENLRKECIDEIINSANDEDQRRRLRGLQFKIDMEREKAKNPMAACIKLSQMMHDSFAKLRDLLKELQESSVNIRNGKITIEEAPAPRFEETPKPEPKIAEVIKINKRLREDFND